VKALRSSNYITLAQTATDVTVSTTSALANDLNARPRTSLVTAWDDGAVSPSFYYRLGTLVLPQNGYRAHLRLEAANGYNVSAGASQAAYYPPTSYACDIYIHSSNEVASVAVTGNTSGLSSPGCYHYGYAVTTSLGPNIQGVLLAPDATNPLTTVTVWVQSGAYWGQPSVTATTTGTWTFSQLKSATLPNTGYVQLPLATTSVGPWVAGRVTGAGVKMADNGRTGYSTAKNGVGRYTVTMNSPHPSGAAFAVFPSVRGNLMATSGTPQANSTQFDIYVYALASVNHADPADFSFFTIP
jgi:hypothetical protein